MKTLAAAAVAALALAIAPSAGASAVTASFGPFSYSLVDLDLDDGVTPYFSVLSAGAARLSGSASASTTWGYDWMSGTVGRMPGFADDSQGTQAELLLSPNTALVITGSYAASWASAADRMTGQFVWSMVGYDNGMSGVFEQAYGYGEVIDLAPGRSGATSGRLGLTLTNADGSEMDLGLVMNLQASVIANPAVSAVPEPDSLVLGAAAAALVAPVARRRRRAAR